MLLQLVTVNAVGKTRKAWMDGREYLVAPMTMLVPGVLNGSNGALLYPEDQVAHEPHRWNGMPIVVDHPQVNGSYVSARSPDILSRRGIGYVFEAKAQGKLTAEGWFDIDKTRKVDPNILANLEAGKPLELSTGLFTDNEAEAGDWNGKPYAYRTSNYRPDHLAVLSSAVGACSIKDGCGVLVNKHLADVNGKLVTVNQPSHYDIRQALDKELVARFGPSAYISEVFDKYVVFYSGDKCFRLAYTTDLRGDDHVGLADSTPEEVKMKRTWVAANVEGEPEINMAPNQPRDKEGKWTSGGGSGGGGGGFVNYPAGGAGSGDLKSADGSPLYPGSRVEKSNSTGTVVMTDAQQDKAMVRWDGGPLGGAGSSEKWEKPGDLKKLKTTDMDGYKVNELWDGDEHEESDELTDNMAPGQPRDKEGKWTNTGAGGSGAGPKGPLTSAAVGATGEAASASKAAGDSSLAGSASRLQENIGEVYNQGKSVSAQGHESLAKAHNDLADKHDKASEKVSRERNNMAEEDFSHGEAPWVMHDRASIAHRTAAEAHTAAASAKRAQAAKKAQTNNSKENLSMLLTPEQRKAKVDGIITNCGCGGALWKESDRPALNALSDERLIEMETQAVKIAANEKVAAAARKGFAEGTTTLSLNEKGEWEKKEAEKPKEEPKPTDNEAAWLKQAPTAVQKQLARLAKIDAKTKETCVNRLTANLAEGPAREQAKAVYNGMDLDQLETLASALPKAPTSNSDGDDIGESGFNYEGAAGGVVNQGDDEELLTIPTTNWAELAQQNSGRKAG